MRAHSPDAGETGPLVENEQHLLRDYVAQRWGAAEEILGIRDLAFQRNQEGPVPEEVIELMRTREVIFAVWPDPNMPFGQGSEILRGGELVADLAGDPRTDDVVVTSPNGRLASDEHDHQMP